MPPKSQTTTRTSRLTKDAAVKKPIAPLKAKAAPNKALPKGQKDKEKKPEKPVTEAAKKCKLKYVMLFSKSRLHQLY
jgi:hypothetical protein